MEPLFNDYEKIILFATLGEDIFSVDEVRFTDDGFFTLYFFFIDKVYALVQLGTCLAIPLLRCYDGAVGVKTGYTKASGRTLVSCAQRGATRFVCVTLSDPDDWNDHTRLLDWAFENYAYRAVAGDTPVYAVPVLSGTVQVCAVTPEQEAYLSGWSAG